MIPLPDLEYRFASAVSRLAWPEKREAVVEAAPLLGLTPNALLDLTDDQHETWRLQEGGSL